MVFSAGNTAEIPNQTLSLAEEAGETQRPACPIWNRGTGLRPELLGSLVAILLRDEARQRGDTRAWQCEIWVLGSYPKTIRHQWDR